MDDDTYDGIVERLRELDPKNPYLVESSPDKPKQIACITGHRDKNLEDMAQRQGIVLTSVLSANITLLILSEGSNQSAKISIARELGITVLTREQFINQYLTQS
jgi:NAD-dependent DNA ligase